MVGAATPLVGDLGLELDRLVVGGPIGVHGGDGEPGVARSTVAPVLLPGVGADVPRQHGHLGVRIGSSGPFGGHPPRPGILAPAAQKPSSRFDTVQREPRAAAGTPRPAPAASSRPPGCRRSSDQVEWRELGFCARRSTKATGLTQPPRRSGVANNGPLRCANLGDPSHDEPLGRVVRSAGGAGSPSTSRRSRPTCPGRHASPTSVRGPRATTSMARFLRPR